MLFRAVQCVQEVLNKCFVLNPLQISVIPGTLSFPHSSPPQITDHYCHSLIQIQADLRVFSQYLSLQDESTAWRTSPQKFR